MLLYELARALAPKGFWWVGFASGPYDHISLEHHGRELGVDGNYRLSPEGAGPDERRQCFLDALGELSRDRADKLVVMLDAPGFNHAITLGLQSLSTDPSVLLTVVVEPWVAHAAVPASVPPEGFDGQVMFDRRRARAGLFPAVDSALSGVRRYPSGHHQLLAERAAKLLADYASLDPGLELPAPETLADPERAQAAQELLRYLRQPFEISEPFHSFPGQSTPYQELLTQVEQLLAS